MAKITSLMVLYVIVLLILECSINQKPSTEKSGLNVLNLMSGLEESANQVSGASGFQKYSSIDKGVYSGTTLYYATGSIFYVNGDMSLFKRVGSLLLNGLSKNATTGDVTYKNEVVSKWASEGTIKDASELALTKVGGETYTVAQVKALGYNFYELSRTENKQWENSKWSVGGTSTWMSIGADPPFIKSYYLIKKTDTEVTLIEMSLNGSSYSISESIESPEESSVFTK